MYASELTVVTEHVTEHVVTESPTTSESVSDVSMSSGFTMSEQEAMSGTDAFSFAMAIVFVGWLVFMIGRFCLKRRSRITDAWCMFRNTNYTPIVSYASNSLLTEPSLSTTYTIDESYSEAMQQSSVSDVIELRSVREPSDSVDTVRNDRHSIQPSDDSYVSNPYAIATVRDVTDGTN